MLEPEKVVGLVFNRDDEVRRTLLLSTETVGHFAERRHSARAGGWAEVPGRSRA